MKFLVTTIIVSVSLAGTALSHSRGCGLSISQLKKKIVRLSLKHQHQDHNKVRVRNRIGPLVNCLLELAPSMTESEKIDLVVGPWDSLWSDQVFGPGVDNSSVVQVVNSDGYYYNISRVWTGNGWFTNFLRGEFTIQGSYLQIEFTANEIVSEVFNAEEDLDELARRFEAGEIESRSVPGPLGVRGVLINAYVDDTLRIVFGNSDRDSRPRLFILSRRSSLR